jgi:hypothetical protein
MSSEPIERGQSDELAVIGDLSTAHSDLEPE